MSESSLALAKNAKPGTDTYAGKYFSEPGKSPALPIVPDTCAADIDVALAIVGAIKVGPTEKTPHDVSGWATVGVRQAERVLAGSSGFSLYAFLRLCCKAPAGRDVLVAALIATDPVAGRKIKNDLDESAMRRRVRQIETGTADL